MNKCRIAAKNIYEITNLASRKNKVLILGNIPLDKASTVSDLVVFVRNEPYPPCVEMFNQAIINTCKVEKQCYILDLKEIHLTA